MRQLREFAAASSGQGLRAKDDRGPLERSAPKRGLTGGWRDGHPPGRGPGARSADG